MLKRVLVVLLAAMVLTPAGQATGAGDLVGGREADEPYSFIVSLHSASGKAFCAGTLITADWLVTAGHCVEGKNAATLSARIGSNDNTVGGEIAKPAEIIVNPSYNPVPDHAGGDLALVRLAAPVKSAPISIGATVAPETPTRLLGWGQMCPTSGCDKGTAKLQQLDTKIVEGVRCTAKFDGAVELCTDNPGGKSGSCYGDSGGPQIAKVAEKWVLLGTISRPGNADPVCATSPSIATSVVAYAQWIAEKITPPGPPA
ncbi:S1 family peptidase [Amycolatopsis regifaucium]|uniref:Serine protease n=1 Tax=Amycolatopsis regifaucium TaxID=546365 RepID=A0A154MU30_9PSEU|nr:serine protease [Amycolatopsis regifaucium]KZB87620.1 serine protease [Amycolatopsis regifaucium]OKA08447.1 serine protease [Amycolatopsis regifaucium]SFI10917.1 Trypsin [Amycolatopsis regifaucium]